MIYPFYLPTKRLQLNISLKTLVNAGINHFRDAKEYVYKEVKNVNEKIFEFQNDPEL